MLLFMYVYVNLYIQSLEKSDKVDGQREHGPLGIEDGKLLQRCSTRCHYRVFVGSYLPTGFLVLCLCGQYGDRAGT